MPARRGRRSAQRDYEHAPVWARQVLAVASRCSFWQLKELLDVACWLVSQLTRAVVEAEHQERRARRAQARRRRAFNGGGNVDGDDGEAL